MFVLPSVWRKTFWFVHAIVYCLPMRVLIFVLLVLMVFSSCKKEQLPKVGEESVCLHHGSFALQTWGDVIWTEGVQYRNPVFNPCNAEEVLYTYYSGDINTPPGIAKFNIRTGEKQILVQNVNAGRPAWHANGKILFQAIPVHQIFIMDEDGSNLMQLTSDATSVLPFWSPDGERVLYFYSPVFGNPWALLSMELETGNVDTLHHSKTLRHTFVTSDNRVLGVQSSYLKLSQPTDFASPIETEVILDLGTIGGGGGASGLTVHSSGMAYISTFANSEEDGLFIFNISSGELTKLRGHCVLNRPTELDVSSDGNSLIVSQSFAYYQMTSGWNKPAGFYQNHKLVHFDLNTHEQTLLEIPE